MAHLIKLKFTPPPAPLLSIDHHSAKMLPSTSHQTLNYFVKFAEQDTLPDFSNYLLHTAGDVAFYWKKIFPPPSPLLSIDHHNAKILPSTSNQTLNYSVKFAEQNTLPDFSNYLQHTAGDVAFNLNSPLPQHHC